MIEGLRHDQNMRALKRRIKPELLRGRSTLVMTEQSTVCALSVRELGFSNEAFSSDRRPAVTGSIS